MDDRAPALLRLLEDYAPSAAEAASYEKMSAFAATTTDPFDRDRFAPGHFTASGFVLSPDGSAVLLIDHRRLGRWLQPGGHVDPGDATPRDAARREVAEESGVVDLTSRSDGLVGIDVHQVPPRGVEPAHLHFDLRFGFTTTTAELAPSPEVAGARWVAFGDLEKTDSDPATVAAIRRYGSLVGATVTPDGDRG